MGALKREETWLTGWFRNLNPQLAAIPDEEMIAADYFAAKYIDSVGVVQLIGDAETEFGIRFDERDFLDRRFSTVQGLAGIIRERSTA